MSNIDKAADLIWDRVEPELGWYQSAETLAQDLADAGLLAEDPTEPDKDSTFAFLGPTWEVRKADGGVFIVTSRHGSVRTPGSEYSPADARFLAYALLAAADHAEKETQ